MDLVPGDGSEDWGVRGGFESDGLGPDIPNIQD